MAIGKILIVDDEEDVREVLKLHLEGENYSTLEAENGDEAIKVLRREMTNVAVILCDIRMPKVDGIECIDYLRREAPSIPIVVVTAYPDSELAVDLMKKGVKDYLVKPVDKEKLVSTVKKLVAAGRSINF
jgi:CheY-like chemotaxis protein